ncbi:MAG: recombinase family protein [Alphaproteobacteria bacterium]
MNLVMPPPIRCAIYTRKSSDEGLEQEFNSLDAQREACEAYIRSQAHDGWRLLPAQFDDGGHSGGTLERPAIQELLKLVRAKQVNVIVIYKIDRLTRSLADFARLAELFDQYGVSFVSVTQQFNTTTSMGRLMLNVLLSFAQFERELTGERIRDKIAASKKKGMWMGGTVPLGYDAKDRTLVINETEAKVVRSLFDLYLEHGSVMAVWEEARRQDYRTKARFENGREVGSKPFFPGHIHFLLSNPLYAGQIRHKGQIYSGQHPRLIDETTWSAVQAKLAENRASEDRVRQNRKGANPLSGLLVDERGASLTPVHTMKDGKRYRYYVANPIGLVEAGRRRRRTRLPAEEIERLVATGLRDAIQRVRLPETLGASIPPRQLAPALERAEAIRHSLVDPDHNAWQVRRPLLRRVIWSEGKLQIDVDRAILAQQLELNDIALDGIYEMEIKAAIAFRGQRMKLIDDNPSAPPRAPDRALIKALARAHDWHLQISRGEVTSVKQIADEEGVTASYVRRVLRLAFLAPDVVEAIVQSNQSAKRLSRDLMLGERVDLSWTKHRQLLVGA